MSNVKYTNEKYRLETEIWNFGTRNVFNLSYSERLTLKNECWVICCVACEALFTYRDHVSVIVIHVVTLLVSERIHLFHSKFTEASEG